MRRNGTAMCDTEYVPPGQRKSLGLAVNCRRPASSSATSTVTVSVFRLRTIATSYCSGAADANNRRLWTGVENGERVTYRREPETGFWKRFRVKLLRILPINSQL